MPRWIGSLLLGRTKKWNLLLRRSGARLRQLLLDQNEMRQQYFGGALISARLLLSDAAAPNRSTPGVYVDMKATELQHTERALRVAVWFVVAGSARELDPVKKAEIYKLLEKYFPCDSFEEDLRDLWSLLGDEVGSYDMRFCKFLTEILPGKSSLMSFIAFSSAERAERRVKEFSDYVAKFVTMDASFFDHSDPI